MKYIFLTCCKIKEISTKSKTIPTTEVAVLSNKIFYLSSDTSKTKIYLDQLLIEQQVYKHHFIDINLHKHIESQNFFQALYLHILAKIPVLDSPSPVQPTF